MARKRIFGSDLRFAVVRFNGVETVVPQATQTGAGGNSVSITNVLEQPLLVHHGGALANADDPLEIPGLARDGKPKPVKKRLSADVDKPGTVLQIKITTVQKPRTRQRLRVVGDPTIIIL